MVRTTLGHYRIERLLGRGGMGEVYAAFDETLARRVAIKMMSPRSAADTDLVERFIREARAASALNHPNIITIYEIGQTDSGAYFIVQEFVEGRTLRSLLPGPLPIDQVVNVLQQLRAALETAHAGAIVHRDIKPENVMIRPDGYIKLLDFGLARTTWSGPASEITTLAQTDPGTLLGTTAYMSPEQANGLAVESPSDMFALGVVAYEMLAGRRPFAGDSPLMTLNAIAAEHPVLPSRLNPNVPAWLDSLVMSLLAKEPGMRPSARDAAQVLDRPGGGASVPTSPAARRSMVGRLAERRALLETLQRVMARDSVMVGVCGEPGIGKSALVDDVLGEMAGHETRPFIARGKCSERLAGAEAYLPLLEVLDMLLHPAGSASSVNDIMRTIAPTWYAHIAASTMLSSEALREDLRNASQERMKRELAALFQEVSRVRPLVVLIEDLQWGDRSTIDVLNYIAGRFEQMHVLIVVTYRPADLTLVRHPFLQVRSELQSRGSLREIALEFLTRDEVREYVALEFQGHRLPDSLTTLIHEKTEGSPLFMTDLLKYLRDRRVIAVEGGAWILARPLGEIARELPETIRSTIARNLERLEKRDHRLALAASVQGHEFDSVVVSDVLGLDPADVEERLDVLQREHRLVRQVETRECPDGALNVRYRFVHVLYQNVLYAELQPTRRTSLSGKVAASLVAHYGAKPKSVAASELALLYETARDFRNAAWHFLSAAQHATSLLAFQEGALLARRGLTALESVPAGEDRTRLEMGLQLALAACLRATEGWAAPSVERIYLRIRDILQQTGDTERLFPVLWGIAVIQAVRSDLETWRWASVDHLRLAERLGNPMYVVAATQMLGTALDYLGEFVQANATLTRQAQLYDPEQHQAYVDVFGLDPGIIGRGIWAHTFAFLGQIDEAQRRAEEAVGLARRQRQPVSIVFALCVGMLIHVLRRDPEAVLRDAAETIDLCESLGLVTEVEWARSYRAWAIAERGDVESAITQLRQSLDRQLALGSRTARSIFLCLLAEQLRRANRIEEAHAAVADGLAFRDQTAERLFQAELLATRGRLFEACDRSADAESSFRAAMAVAQRQSALTFELRTSTALARFLHARGRSAEAAQQLTGVYSRLTEGFSSADVRDAEAMIQTLGVARASPVT